MYKLVRYLFSGGVATLTNLGILFFLTHFLGFHYLLSGIISFLISVVVSFLMQKMWTFEDASNENTHKKFAQYVTLALVNLGMNTLLLYFFTDVCSIHYLISQVLTSGLIAFWSYFLYAKIFANTNQITKI